MSSKTQRVYWGPFQGTQSVNYDWDAISDESVVVIAAAEWNKSDPTTLPTLDRFVGLASISVLNIAPHSSPGGVTFMLNVDWDSALFVCLDITVLDTEVRTNVLTSI
jgi:hypothetical protein